MLDFTHITAYNNLEVETTRFLPIHIQNGIKGQQKDTLGQGALSRQKSIWLDVA